MLRFIVTPLTLPSISPSKAKPMIPCFPFRNLNFPSLYANHVKFQPSKFRSFQSYAKDGNGDGRNNGEDGNNENGLPRFNLRWVNLVVDPDPENIVAVGLIGLLMWASVQILWQLFLISAAILLAALKYTIVATLLVFILITLL